MLGFASYKYVFANNNHICYFCACIHEQKIISFQVIKSELNLEVLSGYYQMTKQNASHHTISNPCFVTENQYDTKTYRKIPKIYPISEKKREIGTSIFIFLFFF